MVSKKLILDRPIWNGGERYVGIATYRLRDNSLRVSCRYRNKSGNPIWQGELLVTKRFAEKFSTKEYKTKGGQPFKVYLIPLDDLIEFNDMLNDKLKAHQSVTSSTYTKEEINNLLLKDANIRKIVEMYPNCQIDPA
tara:strand:- start:1136 stop:1546 length:411 start_codon:yes stop_codon:yes gene_type:complete